MFLRTVAVGSQRDASAQARAVSWRHVGKAENDQVIAEFRYSRYPVIGTDENHPIGYVHVKDLFLALRAGKPTEDLTPYVEAWMSFKETGFPGREALSSTQRKAGHMALAFADDGKWTVSSTLEDVRWRKSSARSKRKAPDRAERPTFPTRSPSRHTLLDVEGSTILSAARNAFGIASMALDLPAPRTARTPSATDRERLGSKRRGKEAAIPHALSARLATPRPS